MGKKLRAKLEEPIPYFKDLLTTAIFFPQPEEYIKDQGDQYATNSERTLFNGSFTLDNWDGIGETWNYRKNEQCWDKDAVNVDKIKVKVMKNPQTAIYVYDNDKMDRVELQSHFVDQYESDDDYHTFLTGGVSFLKMNQGKDGKRLILPI